MRDHTRNPVKNGHFSTWTPYSQCHTAAFEVTPRPSSTCWASKAMGFVRQGTENLRQCSSCLFPQGWINEDKEKELNPVELIDGILTGKRI